MLRSLLLAAAALLLAAPALAQTGTALFGITVSDGGPFILAPEPGTAFVIFSADPAVPPRTVFSPEPAGTRFLTVPDLLPGRYFAFPAASAGLLSVRSPGLNVVADTTLYVNTDVSLVNPALGVVRGRIVEEGTGRPVRFNRIQGPVGGRFEGATTDGDGRFAFQVEPGVYTRTFALSYDASGTDTFYLPVAVAFTATAGGTTTVTDVVARVRPLGQATGTVTDAATGAPLAGVDVLAYDTGNTYGVFVTSGPDGRLAFDLPEGDYVFGAYAPPESYLPEAYDGTPFFSAATLVAVEGGATRSGIDFRLRTLSPNFSVAFAGRITNTAGVPLAGARVVVYDDLVAVDSTTTDATGAFLFTSADPALSASFLAIGFAADGFQPWFNSGQTSLASADLIGVGAVAFAFDFGTVELLAEGEAAAGFAVSGTVRDETTGAPLAGAVVAVARTDAPGRVHFATTDAAGAYRLSGLAAGTYVVLFTEADHAPQFYPDVASWTTATQVPVSGNVGGLDALMGGLNRPVANRPGAPFLGAARPGGGEIDGVVRDAAGAPLGGALVVARGSGGAAQAFALTDAVGRFTLAGLGDGFVTVDVDRARYAPASTATGPAAAGQLFVRLDASAATAGEGTPDARLGALSVFPNPARGRATVAFALAAPGDARVAVVDVLGREVAVAASGAFAAGAHTVAVDTSRLPAGMYVVRLAAGGRVVSQTFTVVR